MASCARSDARSGSFCGTNPNGRLSVNPWFARSARAVGGEGCPHIAARSCRPKRILPRVSGHAASWAISSDERLATTILIDELDAPGFEYTPDHLNHSSRTHAAALPYDRLGRGRFLLFFVPFAAALCRFVAAVGFRAPLATRGVTPLASRTPGCSPF